MEEFLQWTAGELKVYLQQCGVSTSGSKLDLAARALVAYEQKTQITVSQEAMAKQLKIDYNQLLRTYELKVDPNKLTSWEDDMSKWPSVHTGNIFQFILENKAFDTKYIGQYKAQKAYSYFKSGFVGHVQCHEAR